MGSGATLTSKAEFMNEYRMDTKQTVYSIPTKMLYDPAPLNIPDDPGHDVQDPGYEVYPGRQLASTPQGSGAGVGGGGTSSPVDHPEEQRRLQMVWYEGDERALYPVQGDGSSCTRDWAKFDPACGARRRTHAETAYRGYGSYREHCSKDASGTGWLCGPAMVRVARMVVESMDADTETRVLVPVALASGGYVDLLKCRE